MGVSTKAIGAAFTGRWRRRVRALLAVCLATFLAGCAHAPLTGPPSQVRVVVLDGLQPAGHGEGDTEILGWWMTSRDLYRDPNDGFHWGDLLARALERTVPNLKVHSRMDLRSYLATKEDQLKKAYPDLNQKEAHQLVQEQSPLDFGKSLEADFVVSSRIVDAWLSHHRTFHWWSGVAIVEVDVWDVARGEKVWSWKGKDRDMIRSVYGVMDRMSYWCARDAGRQAVFASVRAIEPAPETK